MNAAAGPIPAVPADPGDARLPWPAAPEPTTDPAVDAVLARLDGLGTLPVSEHEALYGSVHDDLFAELDSDTGSAG
ncbi:hypothetical protein KIH31_06310 [Paenarthrobacter sp. DKR-5]|uniref:hypothetical protein n=1 Tax=Paenarthrobacter sp. DKR-5 TaxID=2835535 RepID=UPI001BDD2CD5|nr:hypothetical protein [Paenarthrobacter sp. DKR-5]MBT1002210.1 hypothetical protein [Paenarthrobacter sp. DKR-5]